MPFTYIRWYTHFTLLSRNEEGDDWITHTDGNLRGVGRGGIKGKCPIIDVYRVGLKRLLIRGRAVAKLMTKMTWKVWVQAAMIKQPGV